MKKLDINDILAIGIAIVTLLIFFLFLRGVEGWVLNGLFIIDIIMSMLNFFVYVAYKNKYER